MDEWNAQASDEIERYASRTTRSLWWTSREELVQEGWLLWLTWRHSFDPARGKVGAFVAMLLNRRLGLSVANARSVVSVPQKVAAADGRPFDLYPHEARSGLDQWDCQWDCLQVMGLTAVPSSPEAEMEACEARMRSRAAVMAAVDDLPPRVRAIGRAMADQPARTSRKTGRIRQVLGAAHGLSVNQVDADNRKYRDAVRFSPSAAALYEEIR